MTEKQKLRRALLQKRRALSVDYRHAASAAMVETIASLSAWKRARLILAYFPVGEEVDLVSLWERALAEGKQLAFPRCENSEMHFILVSSLSELEEDAYRIPAPPKDGERVGEFEDALCIVPALSVDSAFYRMGYGGGYYDRFLGKYPEVKTLCALYEEMVSKEDLVREQTDVPVCMIVTEQREEGSL